jgi:hypothetical protein
MFGQGNIINLAHRAGRALISSQSQKRQLDLLNYITHADTTWSAFFMSAFGNIENLLRCHFRLCLKTQPSFMTLSARVIARCSRVGKKATHTPIHQSACAIKRPAEPSRLIYESHCSCRLAYADNGRWVKIFGSSDAETDSRWHPHQFSTFMLPPSYNL